MPIVRIDSKKIGDGKIGEITKECMRQFKKYTNHNDKMKILIITGSLNSEREISLISADPVAQALIKNGHQVGIFDLEKGYSTLKKLLSKYELFFPVLHGEEGESGSLQKFLSKLHKPYVGGDWRSFQEGWYKIPFKKFCKKYGFLTADWKQVKNTGDIINFGFPCVLKASAGGSSKEVAILKSKEDLSSVEAKSILALKDALFIERYLPGIEVTVGILDNQALPVVEITPPPGKWFDYENKYTGTTKEIANAPSLTQEQRNDCQRIALDIHQKLDLGPYSRVDFIFSDNQPYVLEINTIPGLTPESVYPKAALAGGFSFEQMVEKLVQSALHKNPI